MNFGMVLLIVMIVFIVIIVFIYNHLVKLNIRCKNAWSGIDNQLKRRADLIPNLLEVTKGYAKHESETLEKVVEARNKAHTLEEIGKNSKQISSSLHKLLLVAEDYPDLKANELFLNLQIELTGTEDKIAYARQFYNDTVQQFNTAIQVFPNNLLAFMLHYQEKEYFQIQEADREVVEVIL